MNHSDPDHKAAHRMPDLPPPPQTEEEEPARRLPGLPPPPQTEEEEPARRLPGLPPPPQDVAEEPARRLPGLPPPPQDLAEEPARRLPGLPPPPQTEEEEPARRFPGLPPPPQTVDVEPALPPPAAAEKPSNSARVAMDDLEAKGLFLVRPSRSGPSRVAPAPPGTLPGPGSSGRTSDWNLFVQIPASGPSGRLAPASGLPTPAGPAPLAPESVPDKTRKPPAYRAADLLVDEMAGNVRHERFQDFIRRFERPVETPRRALEELYPPGVVDLFDRRDWQALIEGFQRVIPSAPEEAAAWIGLALCALAQKDLKTSCALADHALGLDETLALDRLLAEARPTDPRTWLRLATELGGLGHLEPAMDVCNRIASDLDNPESVRRRAQKIRSKIRHDYFRRRGQADPERPTGANPPRRVLRILGTGLVVLALLGLAWVAFVKARTAYLVDRGEARLALSLNLTEHLKRRDPIADRRAPLEEHVLAAMDDFAEVRRWRPEHVHASFLHAAAADLLLEIGRLRRSTDRRWDQKRWIEMRRMRDQAHEELARLALTPEQESAEETALQVLKLRALRGLGLEY